MEATLLINRTAGEVRVALLEDGRVVAFRVERVRRRGVVGNIYKGRVVRVLPGMQAAFVEVGLEKAGFLFVGDALPPRPPEPRDEAEGGEHQRRELPPIESVLHNGQELLVQVSKDAMGTKGPRLSTQIAIPGRYLVYRPQADVVGVSRRIVDQLERERLRGLVEELREPGEGYILRTITEGCEAEDLQGDMEFLRGLWASIRKRSDQSAPPSRLHRDLDLALQAARDLFGSHVKHLVVDDRGDYERIDDFLSHFDPGSESRLELHSASQPLFQAYGAERQVQRGLGRRVWLKSGAYLVIDPTEALTAIDINSGRNVGSENLELTALKVNLEAIDGIAEQLRLRDIGGLIVIDFIDMERPEHRQQVDDTLSEALAADPARTTVLPLSEFCLVQMTRRRVRSQLQRQLMDPCRHCSGLGMLPSVETMAYEVLRAIGGFRGRTRPDRALRVKCEPAVASYLQVAEAPAIAELQTELGMPLRFEELHGGRVDRYEVLEEAAAPPPGGEE